MIWLIGQMWVLLFFAFALGLAGGYWIWGNTRPRRELRPAAETPMGTLQSETPLQADQAERT